MIILWNLHEICFLNGGTLQVVEQRNVQVAQFSNNINRGEQNTTSIKIYIVQKIQPLYCLTHLIQYEHVKNDIHKWAGVGGQTLGCLH